MSQKVGWWWPFDKLVLVTPVPDKLYWDGDQLMGFEYPDGFSWKGLGVRS